MRPKRYEVTHGHLIDQHGTVSPQIDLIVADNNGMPSLFTAADGTRYIPVESVFAVAEIKSTFYRSQKPISGFSKTLRIIREEMARPLEINTAYEGLQDTTEMRHIMLGCLHKYLNPLFAFMVIVDAGDMTEDALDEELQGSLDMDLPAMTAILNRSIVFYGSCEDDGFKFEKYPALVSACDHSWHVSPMTGGSDGSTLEGNHLGMIYYALLSHLNQTFLEPPNLTQYFSRMLVGRKSSTREINKSNQGI